MTSRAKKGLIVAALVVLGLVIAIPALRSQAEETAVDEAKIEQFLRKIVQAQKGGKVTVEPGRTPSPIEGLEEIHFFIESSGTRQPGVVYISGNKLILGQMIDLTTETNLTTLGLAKPSPVTYKMERFDLKGRAVRGAAAAPLTLVEFSDFQCPYCKRLHNTLEALKKKYPGKVRLYYKHFPLVSIHPLAYPMALATECAKRQNEEAFWLLHDNFFDDQYTGQDTDLFMKRLKSWAEGAGLNADRLTTCVATKELASVVDADIQEGKELGITGTPAIIANGQFLPGAQPLEVFERLLNLAAASPMPPGPPRPPSHPSPPTH